MVNASNLNITHIGGKPVIIANKPGGTSSLISGQQLQSSIANTSSSGSSVTTTSLVIGGQTLKVQGNLNLVGAPNNASSAGGTQHVMFGNQIVKIQSANPQNMAKMGNINTSNCAGTKTVVLSTSGQTFKVHSGNSILHRTDQKKVRKLLFILKTMS